MMNLEEFLHNLHFDVDKVSSPHGEVDWEDAPLSYKLYLEWPAVPLSPEVPLTLEEWEAPVKPDLLGIGHFLWYVFGITEFYQSVYSLDSTKPADVMQSHRRFVPSGGALYPNELYVYLKLEDLPAGVYHYDAAHHSLVRLREGHFDSYIDRALGHRLDVSPCFGTVFVSTIFWKNFFKYNNFAYRLQGLDAGVLIGQLLEVAKRFGFETSVCFQFLDRGMNHLLGLSEQEESVYAVIPLSVAPASWIPNRRAPGGNVSAAELCRELPSIQYKPYVRSSRVKEYPMLTTMNEASMLESTCSIQQFQTEGKINKENTNKGNINKEKINSEDQAVVLPHVKRVSYDLATVCRERYSPDMDFVLGKVSQMQLATLLREATTSFLYRNDLDGTLKHESRVFLYGCLYHVEGIPDGAYRYDSNAHVLQQVHPGDHRLRLQYGMSLGNVNLLQVPLCLHVAGDREHYKTALGYRGYRIQQMEAGMLVQRLLLSASALGLGGHPLLGFDASLCDDIYDLDSQGKTSLIQIPVGPYRHRPWLRGGLHS